MITGHDGAEGYGESIENIGAAFVSLGVQVHDRIRDYIASGRFEPGQRLKERDLAEAFGVSRLPVREALRQLEKEGYVITLPRRGVVVRTLSERDLEELYEVREALEGQIMKLAASRATDEDKDGLTGLIARASAARATGDLAQLRLANLEIHDQITRASHNELLKSMMEPLSARMFWVFSKEDDPEGMVEEHGRMVEAICEGDARRAEELGREHVRASFRSARAILNRMQVGSEAVSPR